MANFENKDTPSKLDTGWKEGAYIKSIIDIDSGDPSYEDKDCTTLSFAWFRVESNMQPSQKEEIEKQEAMKKQYDLKVINKYGMPYGMPMPKEVKDKIRKMEEEQAQKSNKWMKKRQKLINKQIEKDMKKKKIDEERQKSALLVDNSTSSNTSNIIDANKPISPTLLTFLK
jgi:hypothetical protein